MEVKLYLDEDVRKLLAIILRDRGYDVISAVEVPLIGVSDRKQLEFAAQENRAILTHNIRDFIMLAREYKSASKPHSGIIVSDQLELGELLNRCLRLLSSTPYEKILNTVVWLQDFKK